MNSSNLLIAFAGLTIAVFSFLLVIFRYLDGRINNKVGFIKDSFEGYKQHVACSYVRKDVCQVHEQNTIRDIGKIEDTLKEMRNDHREMLKAFNSIDIKMTALLQKKEI